MNKKLNLSTKNIAKAIFIVNKHAKTAPEPQHLYEIKKRAINKLIKQKRCKKIGLHFSNHPKMSNQHSTMLVQVANYYFHILPNKNDFKQFEHLGSLDDNYRNPPTKMALSEAKKIIYTYINWKPEKHKNHRVNPSSYYTPSALGDLSWQNERRKRQY